MSVEEEFKWRATADSDDGPRGILRLCAICYTLRFVLKISLRSVVAVSTSPSS